MTPVARLAWMTCKTALWCRRPSATQVRPSTRAPVSSLLTTALCDRFPGWSPLRFHGLGPPVASLVNPALTEFHAVQVQHRRLGPLILIVLLLAIVDPPSFPSRAPKLRFSSNLDRRFSDVTLTTARTSDSVLPHFDDLGFRFGYFVIWVTSLTLPEHLLSRPDTPNTSSPQGYDLVGFSHKVRHTSHDRPAARACASDGQWVYSVFDLGRVAETNYANSSRLCQFF